MQHEEDAKERGLQHDSQVTSLIEPFNPAVNAVTAPENQEERVDLSKSKKVTQ